MALIASILFIFGSVAFAADDSRKGPHKEDVTFGRVKEMTAGQKIVIDVDNASDKSFDLTDKDKTVNLAKGLKVGDPVMVTERELNGKKVVDIAHHSDGGFKHGAKSRGEEVEKSPKK